MNDPYIASGEWDGSRVLVAGLALTGLSGGAELATSSGKTESAAFAEIALAVVRRACRHDRAQVILRARAGEQGFGLSVLFSGSADASAGLAGLVREATSLLARWQPEPLDRAALLGVLYLPPDWETVRLMKPDEAIGNHVAALVAANADPGAWYSLIARDHLVFDVGIFPLQVSDVETRVREIAAASKVHARYADTATKGELEANAAAAESARGQGVYAGVAMTLTCAGAMASAGEVRAFRHPRRGEVPGKAMSPDDVPHEQLPWAVLDYAEEAASLTSLEPDLRQALALPCLLGFHWSDWRKARRLMDPLDYLFGRVEMFEERLAHKLDEIRDALAPAKSNLAASIGSARVVMERIVQHHYQRHFPSARKLPPVFDMIEQLGPKVPKPIASLMHTIRTFGNAALHAGDFPLSVHNLGVVFEALCLLVEWHLSEK